MLASEGARRPLDSSSDDEPQGDGAGDEALPVGAIGSLGTRFTTSGSYGLYVLGSDRETVAPSSPLRNRGLASLEVEDDSGEEDAAPQGTTRIYFTLCLGVQMFMSYDGGATPATLDIIKEELNMTQTEIGMLGSLDKVGQTIFSVAWGRALQILPTKWLLVASLLTNALFSLLFGLVMHKHLMFTCKFMQGSTEALQGVWGTVWTLSNAPAKQRSTWMGLGAIAAGLGNGVGTAVAGFGTANGLPYSVAFVIQASVLGMFWFFLLSVSQRALSVKPESHKHWEGIEEERRIDNSGEIQIDDSEERLSDSSSEASSSTDSEKTTSSSPILRQLCTLWGSRLFLRTLGSVTAICFFTSGTQFVWVRTFIEGPWTLNKNYAVTSFLVVTGAGSVVGVLLGPRIIDLRGGYSDAGGRVKTLRLLLVFALLAVVGASAAVLAIGLRMRIGATSNVWDPLLWMLWVSVILVFMSLNASIAAFTGINCESVPVSMRPFAAGTAVSMQNLLGYAGGAFLPGVAMDWAYSGYWVLYNVDLSLPSQIGMGFIFVSTSPIMVFLFTSLALCAAREAQE